MNAGAILYALYALLTGAALQDLWKLRISNLFPVAILGLFPVWALAAGVERDIWQNALFFTIILAIGTFLFARHWFGGGDVKLLAAVAMWFDLSGGLALLVYVTMGGGLLSLIFIILRRLTPALVRDQSGWAALKRRGPIPYGLAIALGAILCVHFQGVNPSGRPTLPEYLQLRTR